MTLSLEEILREHSLWLKNETGGICANLSGADLSKADLSEADLRGANLSEADLRCADLSESNLSGADLRCADLRGANLYGADLREADLRGANLYEADLYRADLREADLRGADLDYSAWPLWCGSLGVKVDVRIARQIAYHFCRLDCSDPEYLRARNLLIDFANGFHRVNECGMLENREREEVKADGPK